MNEPIRIALFGVDRTDARLVRRLAGLRDGGAVVSPFSFDRNRGSVVVEADGVNLGRTYDRRYAQRGMALARAVTVLWGVRRQLAAVDRFYAINADNAVLALAARLMARSGAPLAVEIADVQPFMRRRGPGPALARGLERAVLRRSDLVVTTSPSYVRNWFEPVHNRGDAIIVLENKVYPPPPIVSHTAAPAAGPPWVVGWFGALNCERSFRLILDMASELGGRVRFLLAGYPTFAELAVFQRQVDQATNADYLGPYRYPTDLPGLYSRVHLAWGLDFTDRAGNSSWSLRNRIYESAACGVPLLAQAGTETGEWVRRHSTGWALTGDVTTALGQLLRSLEPVTWSAARRSVLAAPGSVVFGGDDHRRLVQRFARQRDGSASVQG